MCMYTIYFLSVAVRKKQYGKCQDKGHCDNNIMTTVHRTDNICSLRLAVILWKNIHVFCQEQRIIVTLQAAFYCGVIGSGWDSIALEVQIAGLSTLRHGATTSVKHRQQNIKILKINWNTRWILSAWVMIWIQVTLKRYFAFTDKCARCHCEIKE